MGCNGQGENSSLQPSLRRQRAPSPWRGSELGSTDRIKKDQALSQAGVCGGKQGPSVPMGETDTQQRR